MKNLYIVIVLRALLGLSVTNVMPKPHLRAAWAILRLCLAIAVALLSILALVLWHRATGLHSWKLMPGLMFFLLVPLLLSPNDDSIAYFQLSALTSSLLIGAMVLASAALYFSLVLGLHDGQTQLAPHLYIGSLVILLILVRKRIITLANTQDTMS